LDYSTSAGPQYQPATAGGYSTSPSGPRLAGTSQLGGAPPQTQGELLSTGAGLLQWGIVHLYPHFLYQISYGNGIQASPGEQANTLINQLSPGLTIRLGQHWTLDYTPTLIFYSSPLLKDALNQAVSLSGFTTYEDWSFNLSIGYSDTSDPLIETAGQTDQQVFSAGVGAVYHLNSKVFFTFGLNQSLNYYGQTSPGQPSPYALNDTRSWSTMDWINYQIGPPISVGMGVGFTYNNVSVGPDIISEQYQARVNWLVQTKLSLSLSIGLIDQQFLGSSVPDLLTPLGSLGLNYQLFKSTGLFLNASVGSSPAVYANQVSQYVTLNAGIHQRLFRRLFLDVSGSYSTTLYYGTTPAANAAGPSNYDTTSFNVALSTTFFKRLTASAFYQATFNSSASTLYNYNTHQVGLTLGYSF
jgi:hypothetical protein